MYSAYTAVAVAKIVNGVPPQVWSIFRDHQGSITHIKNGSTVQEYSFDAWGRRRSKDMWSNSVTDSYALFANRGFTGHEHLTEFGLINMNGRLYDPLVGRFLNPDNYVQDASNPQSFNRYSYCLNNPLKYTDPSGNKWDKWYDWINPMNYFNEGMQFINDNTTGLRQWMVDARVPAFGVNVSIGSDGYATTPDLEAYKTSKGLIAQSAKYDSELNGWRNAPSNGGGGIDLQGGKVITQMVDRFGEINSNHGIIPYSNKSYHVSDIIDANSIPGKKRFFNKMYGSITSDGVNGFSYFGDKMVQWNVIDRNFMENYSENYISYIYGDHPRGNMYRIRAMYNNETRISLIFNDYDLYQTMYNRIFK